LNGKGTLIVDRCILIVPRIKVGFWQVFGYLLNRGGQTSHWQLADPTHQQVGFREVLGHLFSRVTSIPETIFFAADERRSTLIKI
jgi:hypothetical protein